MDPQDRRSTGIASRPNAFDEREELEKGKNGAIENLLHSSTAIICISLRCYLPSLSHMSIVSPDSTPDPWGQQPTSVSVSV